MAKIAQLTPAQHTRLSQNMQRTGALLGLVSGLGVFGLFAAYGGPCPMRMTVSMCIALVVVGPLAGWLLGRVVMRSTFCGTLLASQFFCFATPFVVGLVFDVLMFDPWSDTPQFEGGPFLAELVVSSLWIFFNLFALFVGVVFVTRWSSALRTFAEERATLAP